jgi:hypothetical protein
MNQQGQILRFLQKYFQSDVFEKDGFKFEFVKVGIEKNFMEAYKLLVNVVLPNPNQSYIVTVFEEMVTEIIKGAFDFLGTPFSYSINITVDGKELFRDTYMFIRNDSLDTILENCNKKFERIGIVVDFGQGEKSLTFDCKFEWENNPYEIIQENCEFNFKMHLSNFELIGNLDNQNVIPNPEKINIVAGTLRTILVERDWFTPVIEDIIYEEIIPDTRIDKTDDIYAVAVLNIGNINGKQVKPKETFYIVQPNDFIEVS